MSAFAQPPSRKEREFVQRRESILNTALDLFAKKGFHKVSMSEIARDSEFSVGSLYNFFPNKEALYKAMILEKTGEMCRQLEDVARCDLDDFTKICLWVAKKIDLYRENIGIFRLFLSETLGINAIVRSQISMLLKEKQHRLRKDLAALFAGAMEKQLLPPMGEPIVLAIALDGICNSLLSAEEEISLPNPVEAETVLTIFFASQDLPREKMIHQPTVQRRNHPAIPALSRAFKA
ncbi:TetR/AcrR family transcriptional regulator [Desulfobotulus sp. H1]|uniref:TetR/AcrR family transcriptional regulator n=1 Tax=Desulfobotulus pelophilus TaxID=2823377 RepID=A0ABT3N9G0_9BACT|nr:TetR/AcrR family transcriptional regulator [Desulfobotulus pelophilus]MCW7754090.1 TetR/AcrR family transcriptional regulator [Desulfobotulus pelophilus]